ncbi:MAG: hypothetical protein JNN01_07745 [Opitutaceae bacterium]|nr:hypothetical protein [Opitutaceae bacterium]
MLANLQAQVTWSTVGTPTMETLWGVTYGGGQFVAVGENGAILTSPDGRVWTARTSGTTAWLLGVAHDNGLFVVVGDQATVLVSHDGIEWKRIGTTRTVGPWERLNGVGIFNSVYLAVGEAGAMAQTTQPLAPWTLQSATPARGWWRGVAFGMGLTVLAGQEGIAVSGDNLPAYSVRSPGTIRNVEGVAFGRGRFVAVGEGGATLTSQEGVTWTPGSAGTVTTLRGVTFFNGLFVAVGDAGRVVTSPDGVTWTTRATAHPAGLRAVTSSPAAVVAVGEQGIVQTSALASLPPTVVSAIEPVTGEVGDATYLQVEVSGSEPMTYRWLREGVPVPGGDGPVLGFPELQASHTGDYTVVVANAHGTTTSAPVRLTVMPPSTPGVVDETFDPHAAVTRPPTALLSLPGDRVLVAGGQTGRLVRLRAEGVEDPGFAAVTVTAAPSEFAAAEVDALALQPDGRLLAGGRFSQVNGQNIPRLVRLRDDGGIDPTFSAPAVIATGGGIRDIKVQADGKIVVANGSSRIWRLLPDGTVDAGFSGREVPETAGVARVLFHTLALAPDGKIVAGGSYAGRSAQAGPVRFHSDGSVDRQLAVPPLDAEPGFGTLSPYETDALLVLADGRIMAAGTRSYQAFHQIEPTVLQYCQRYLDTGDPDPAYQAAPPPVSETGARYWSRAWFYPDGRTLLACRFDAVGGPQFTRRALVRLTAGGATDPTIGGAVLVRNDGSTVRQLRLTSSGRILVAGDMTFRNRTLRPFLARLNDVATEGTQAPRDARLTASAAVSEFGAAYQLQANVRGSGRVSYLWGGAGVLGGEPRPDRREVNFPGVQTVVMVNARGSITARVVVEEAPFARPPQILNQPRAISAQSGRDIVLAVTAGTERYDTPSYEWRKDGVFLAFTYGPLFLNSATPGMAGAYTVTVRDRFGNATVAEPMVVTVDDTSRFINLSARAWVGPGSLYTAGEQGLFAGFIVPGPNKRRLLIRGLGPALRRFGVQAPLTGVQISVLTADGRSVGYNDGWDAFPFSYLAAKASDFVAAGAFPLDAGSKDAAMVIELDPGAYTVSLNGEFDFANQKPGVGVGLIELYEYDNRADRLVNLSARVMVGVGGEAAIPGVAVRGPVPKRLLVRAVGPGLAAFGVGAPLANPRLEVRDEAGRVVAENEDWNLQPDPASVRQAAASAGAFALAEGSRDAARVITVVPGNYTLVVNGPLGASGIALVEVYELP